MPLRRSLGILLTALGTFAITPAAAQVPVSADAAQLAAAAADIVVTGRRGSARQDLANVRTVTRRYDGQIARFATELCPLVLGLPRPQAEVVESRIQGVAQHTGLGLAPAGCRPNLTVMVADDGPATIAALRQRRPRLFETLKPHELTRLAGSKGPAWSWYQVEPKRRDGAPIERMTMISYGPSEGARPVSRGAYIASNVDLARLTTPVRLDIALSFVVLGREAVDGLTLAQVGDFAAVLGLSMISYDQVKALRADSILRLFDNRSAGDLGPGGATDFDLAYLKGLYGGDPGQSYERRAADIASRIRRASGTGAEPGAPR